MAIDISPILNVFVSSQVIVPVLAVVGTMAALFAALYAARLVLAVIRGDWSHPEHVSFYMPSLVPSSFYSNERQFERRYQRELKNREYRAWKKSKGRL